MNKQISEDIKEEKHAWTNDGYHGVSETGVLIKPICDSEVCYKETRNYSLCDPVISCAWASVVCEDGLYVYDKTDPQTNTMYQ